MALKHRRGERFSTSNMRILGEIIFQCEFYFYFFYSIHIKSQQPKGAVSRKEQTRHTRPLSSQEAVRDASSNDFLLYFRDNVIIAMNEKDWKLKKVFQLKRAAHLCIKNCKNKSRHRKKISLTFSVFLFFAASNIKFLFHIHFMRISFLRVFPFCSSMGKKEMTFRLHTQE